MASTGVDAIHPEDAPYLNNAEGNNNDNDENEFPFLKADHPALERVQVALKKQLTVELEKVNLVLRDKEEELKRTNKEREDVGVQLFGIQQQLVKLQVSLEGSYDEIEAAKKNRTLAEERLSKVQEIYEAKKVDLDQSFKRMQRINDELNQLNITLRQVEEYNESMKSEIQITRRGTYKAENMITEIEKVKTKQDFLIDKMNEDINKLTETKALYEAQLLAQKQETEAALTTQAEAQREISAIEEEMTRMNTQWKKLMMDIKFRDEVLSTMNDNIRKLEENELNVDSEIRGMKTATKAAQEELQRLTELQARNAKETELLAVKKKNMEIEMERLRETRAVLQASMNHTNKESARVEQAINALNQQRTNYDSAAQQATAATVKTKDAMFDLVSQQKTLDKSTDNTTKAARKINEQIKGLHHELIELNNEIARVEVDVLNITAHNQLLQERLKQLTADLAEKQRQVDEHEQEIAKRHHTIEKKQLQVDRLNKEYDEKKRANAAGGEDAGPLEAEHANLRREINTLAQEQGHLQTEWTTKQTNLIELQQKLQEYTARTEAASHHLVVMQQRRLRLERDLTEKNSDVINLEKESNQVQSELDKLNPLVFELQDKLATLSRDVELQRKDADGEISAMKRATEIIEEKLLAIKDEKAALRDQLAEAERQTMLWERRILLEREVVEALDPSVGQVEMSTMRKEIHRMELREEKLKRQKEELVLEMERVIAKKDSVELKYGTRSKTPPPNAKVAGGRNAIRRKIQSLDSSIQQAREACNEADNNIIRKEDELKDLSEQLASGHHEVAQLASSLNTLENSILQKRALKYRSNADIIRFKRAASIFTHNAVAQQNENGGAADAADFQGLERIIDSELSVAERIQSAIREVYESHPTLDAPLNIFLEWATTIARAIGGAGATTTAEDDVVPVVEVENSPIEATDEVVGPISKGLDGTIVPEFENNDNLQTVLVGGEDEEGMEGGLETTIPDNIN